jgi:hypothetical protein
MHETTDEEIDSMVNEDLRYAEARKRELDMIERAIRQATTTDFAMRKILLALLELHR